MDDDTMICDIWVDTLQAPSWLSLHYPSITQYMGILDSIKDIVMCIAGNPTNSANFYIEHQTMETGNPSHAKKIVVITMGTHNLHF